MHRISFLYQVIFFFFHNKNHSCVALQELEKSKPVVLTGDLNCAHEEIDIYNPAVSIFIVMSYHVNDAKAVYACE